MGIHPETKNKIRELTNRIIWLTEDFQKVDYPPIKSIEEENKRIEALKKQGGWGASGTAVEQTIEIPIIPETKKGLKFDAAAKELKIISDEFFKLRNHNPAYKKAMKNSGEIWFHFSVMNFYTNGMLNNLDPKTSLIMSYRKKFILTCYGGLKV